MFYCTQCGNALEDGMKFCNRCGVPATEPAAPAAPEYVEIVCEEPACTAPETPVYAAPEAPVYEPFAEQSYYMPPVNPYAPAPYVEATPVVSVKDKAMGFVGMGLGIGGLFFAVFGLLYTLMGMVETGVAFVFSLIFGLISMPLSILGRKFAGDSAEHGNTAAACSVGAKLGIAGLVVSCVMLFFGFINLFVM